MAPKVMGEVSRSIKFQHQRPGLLKNLMQIVDSSICAPKSLMMSLPLTFVLSADTETDVRLIHHSPLGNLDCQWYWQTSGEIAPCGPCRSSGSSVIDRKSNSIPFRMLSWLTGSITAQVYSPGHLSQSLRHKAGLIVYSSIFSIFRSSWRTTSLIHNGAWRVLLLGPIGLVKAISSFTMLPLGIFFCCVQFGICYLTPYCKDCHWGFSPLI